MTAEAKVYIIDDDPGMRDSLEFLLETRGYRVAVFPNARAFLDAGYGEEAGCALVDVRLPDMTGLELQQHLLDRQTHLRLVVITGHGDVAMAVSAMKAGAIDFIEKPLSEDALITSIERALEASRHAASRSSKAPRENDPLGALTGREREVFDQLTTGNPHKVIAYQLQISPRTVEVHRARIMQKLGARNLADLVRLKIASEDGT